MQYVLLPVSIPAGNVLHGIFFYFIRKCGFYAHGYPMENRFLTENA